MKCSVWNCKNRRNNKNKISFFSFPSEKNLREKWLQFCKLNKPFNHITCKICIEHFNNEDIDGHLQLQMGLCAKRRVKPGALPRINKNLSSRQLKRINLLQKLNNKMIVDKLIQESNELNMDTETNTSITVVASTVQSVYNIEDFMEPVAIQPKSIVLKPANVEIHHDVPANVPSAQNIEETQVTKSNRENSSLQENISKLEHLNRVKYEMETDDLNEMCEFLPETLPSSNSRNKQSIKCAAAKNLPSETKRKRIKTQKRACKMVLSTATTSSTIDFLKEEKLLASNTKAKIKNSVALEPIINKPELEPDDSSEMCALIEQVLSDSPSTSSNFPTDLTSKQIKSEFENIEIESDEEFLSDVPSTVSTYQNNIMRE